MKNYISVICLMIMFFSNCKEKSSQRKFYYKTGELKKEITYNNANDTTSFYYISYYKNGNPWQIRQLIKGQFNGKSFDFYKNGILEYSRTYKNHKLHGVGVNYDSIGRVIDKALFLNDRQINIIEFYYSKDGRYIREKIFRFHFDEDSTCEAIGGITYDTSGYIIDSSSFYYNIEADDTIDYGENFHFQLNFHINHDFSLKLLIGELDKELEFVNPDKVITYTSPNKTIAGKVEEYESGWNLLLGKLYAYPDPQLPKSADEYEFIVYKEFYVREKE